MIDLCYHLALVLCRVAVDGDKFSFTVSFRPVPVQPPSQIDHHRDKLYSCECCWVKFIRGADVGREVLLCAMVAVCRCLRRRVRVLGG